MADQTNVYDRAVRLAAERDEAVARAEEAERERDIAREDRAFKHRQCETLANRADAAVARAEHAEALLERAADVIAALDSYAASSQMAPLERSQRADAVLNDIRAALDAGAHTGDDATLPDA